MSSRNKPRSQSSHKDREPSKHKSSRHASYTNEVPPTPSLTSTDQARDSATGSSQLPVTNFPQCSSYSQGTTQRYASSSGYQSSIRASTDQYSDVHNQRYSGNLVNLPSSSMSIAHDSSWANQDPDTYEGNIQVSATNRQESFSFPQRISQKNTNSTEIVSSLKASTDHHSSNHNDNYDDGKSPSSYTVTAHDSSSTNQCNSKTTYQPSYQPSYVPIAHDSSMNQYNAKNSYQQPTYGPDRKTPSHTSPPPPLSTLIAYDSSSANQYDTKTSSEQPFRSANDVSSYNSRSDVSLSNSYGRAPHISTPPYSYPTNSYPTNSQNAKVSYNTEPYTTQTSSHTQTSNNAPLNIKSFRETIPSLRTQESQKIVPEGPTGYVLSGADICPLAEEFIEHLCAELRSNVYFDTLKQRVQDCCGSLERTAASEALQGAAAQIASDLITKMPGPLDYQARTAKNALWRAGIPSQKLRTKKDFAVFIGDFATINLNVFYPPGDRRVGKIAEEIVAQKSLLPAVAPELKAGMSKLALYDIIFLCDNSGSMAIEEGGKRITALRDTLRRVTSFATKLNPEGISIRVLNRTIGDVDYRKSEHEVEKAMRNVRYEGPTLLGTVLESKIIYPLITRKAYDKKLKKPVIVVIVTDGEAMGEPQETLRETILACKRSMLSYNQPPGSTVFLISRVGNSPTAAAFLESLSADLEIGSMVYSSEKDLLMKREVFQRTGDDAAYTGLLVQLFLSALQAAVTSRVP